MITMSSLGQNGRLGNQLFQYAFLYALSRRRSYELVIPKVTELEPFNISATVGPAETSRFVRESNYCNCDAFVPELYNGGDDTDYWGYFQTEKYFSDFRSEIQNEFSIDRNIGGRVDKLWGDKYDKLIAIHVRRGDTLKEHTSLPLSYYQRAMKVARRSGYQFISVSDDIQWCKGNLDIPYYAENLSVAGDLYLMTRCAHLVVSNSSLSWWGSWLSDDPSRHIVAPSAWRCGAKHTLRDGWTLVDPT